MTSPLGGALEFALENRAGRAELNLSDGPQSLVFVITNRSSDSIATRPGSTLVVGFRAGTLRSPQHIRLAPRSLPRWAIAHDPAAHTMTLTATATGSMAPGETWTIHLTGIAGNPVGGTRSTRVGIAYHSFDSDVGEIAGQQLIHLGVRDTRVVDPDLQSLVGAGSVAVVGPFTAGFIGGAAALNSFGASEAFNQLHLRIVNSSGRPIRLAADDDAATRLVFDHRSGTATMPWGLVSSHGDHVDWSEPEGGRWVLEGAALRCHQPSVWSPGDPLDITIDLHTSAEPHQAKLIVRFENLPEYDDTTMVLLVDIGPLAGHHDRTTTIHPIELWGNAAQIDFATAESHGDLDAAPRSSLLAENGGVLRLVTEWLRIVDRSHTRWSTVDQGEEPALELGVFGDGVHIQSRAVLPLRLNPQGAPVTIGEMTAATSEAELTVGGRLRVVSSVPGGAAAALSLVAGADSASLQSENLKPLRINPFGNGVEIGVDVSRQADSTVPTDPAYAALTVCGRTTIIDDAHDTAGRTLVIGARQERAAELAIGVDTDYAWIASRWPEAIRTAPKPDDDLDRWAAAPERRQKPLSINRDGGIVGIGAGASIASFLYGAATNDAALTVGNGLVVFDTERRPPQSDLQRGALVVRATGLASPDGPKPPELHLGVSAEYAWIETTGNKRLRLNSNWGSVGIGCMVEEPTGVTLTVSGRTDIVGAALYPGITEDQQIDVAELVIRMESGADATELRLGVYDDYAWIQSVPIRTLHNDFQAERPLRLNPCGSDVQLPLDRLTFFRTDAEGESGPEVWSLKPLYTSGMWILTIVKQ